MEPKPLRCSYCGHAIAVVLGWHGAAYLNYQAVDGFECDDYACGAEWDIAGEPTVIGRETVGPEVQT